MLCECISSAEGVVRFHLIMQGGKLEVLLLVNKMLCDQKRFTELGDQEGA